ALDRALAANSAANLPAIDVSPNQGKFLYLLAKMSGAKRILELGTLGGYSTIWLARAVGDDGKVITVEFEQDHIDVASNNIQNAGLARRVDIVKGAALQIMQDFVADGAEPFDMIFIDADKPNNAKYIDLAFDLSKSGTVIVGDNVVRGGDVINNASVNPSTIGVQRFNDKLAQHAGSETAALQIVGSKGYDGLTITIVD
ncbi:MAG: O-methyltransferase, partial [Cohaesibacter sp.]|nr:O-methyltransferase [Cohaesibacter sp.]